jgi:hypothetical protein
MLCSHEIMFLKHDFMRTYAPFLPSQLPPALHVRVVNESSGELASFKDLVQKDIPVVATPGAPPEREWGVELSGGSKI